MNLVKEKKIIVCSNCLKASCWQGQKEFMCKNSRNADTTIKTIKELKKLNLENSDYWKN